MRHGCLYRPDLRLGQGRLPTVLAAARPGRPKPGDRPFTVLYPYFVDQLEDEQYLQGFGLRQGRFDFAVTGLGLIVEVKVMRNTSDINKLESEIADDLALYFKDGNPFRTMIVYIYDDRDKPEPENYPAIRDAFKRRSERIVDVVIVQRPSMIPNRKERK